MAPSAIALFLSASRALTSYWVDDWRSTRGSGVRRRRTSLQNSSRSSWVASSSSSPSTSCSCSSSSVPFSRSPSTARSTDWCDFSCANAAVRFPRPLPRPAPPPLCPPRSHRSLSEPLAGGQCLFFDPRPRPLAGVGPLGFGPKPLPPPLVKGGTASAILVYRCGGGRGLWEGMGQAPWAERVVGAQGPVLEGACLWGRLEEN